MTKIFIILLFFFSGCSAENTKTQKQNDLNITCSKIHFDESNLYFYNAEVVSVYDGDTIIVNIDLGFNIWIHNERLRLSGINAPEIRTKDKDEKKRGLQARDYLRSLIQGKKILIKTLKDKKGKYGRYLAEIYLNRENINDKLVKNGYAVYKQY